MLKYFQTEIKLLFLNKNFYFLLIESSSFEKLMTYSGLVSGYMWSKKAEKKENLVGPFKIKP
jgi:hypothetical protein